MTLYLLTKLFIQLFIITADFIFSEEKLIIE